MAGKTGFFIVLFTFIVGCNTTSPKKPAAPDPWVGTISLEADENAEGISVFLVRANAPFAGNWALTKKNIRKKARAMVLEKATKRTLRRLNKEDLWKKKPNLIKHDILSKQRKFLGQELEVQGKRYDEDSRYGMELQIRVDTRKIAALFEEKKVVRFEKGSALYVLRQHNASVENDALNEMANGVVLSVFKDNHFNVSPWDLFHSELEESGKLEKAGFKKRSRTKFGKYGKKSNIPNKIMKRFGRYSLIYKVDTASVQGRTITVIVKVTFKDHKLGKSLSAPPGDVVLDIVPGAAPQAGLLRACSKAANRAAKNLVNLINKLHDREKRKNR